MYIIDPANRVRAVILYPASCGRDFDEVLRVLDSLQLTDRHEIVATPANWCVSDLGSLRQDQTAILSHWKMFTRGMLSRTAA